MPEESRLAVLVTCEHGGNRVPAAWRRAFTGAAAALRGHRGHDPGALVMARLLARTFRAPLLASTVTRLLVDLNREETHRRVFSEWTRSLPAAQRRRLLDTHHRPFRQAARARVAAARRRGQVVVHISSHSFTPVLRGRRRDLDVGLLYDPARPLERALALCWRRALSREAPELRVRLNRPYLGTSDGLTRWLRRRFAARGYAGLELELNQALLRQPARRRGLRAAVARSLRSALDDLR